MIATAAVLWVTIGGGAMFLVLAVLFYLRAAATRETHSCPSRGERVTVEQMKATRCNTCGAPLDGRGE